jgi:hypothetical protein
MKAEQLAPHGCVTETMVTTSAPFVERDVIENRIHDHGRASS